MTHLPRPHAWFRLIGLALALTVIALIGAACVPAILPVPDTTSAPAAVVTQPSAATAAPAKPAASTPVAAPQQPVKKVDLPVGVDADGNFYQGDLKAPVKLVEFSEFQCPYCGRHFLQTAPQLDETFIATGKVLHVFRNFPLDFHPNAMPAAKAAYCAGQQNPKYFWNLHDWLFTNQNTWSNDTNGAAQFRAQAIALGVDGAKYDACLIAPATEARIQRDIQDGAKLGVQGTPGFFINDWFLAGAYPFEEFQKVIGKATSGLHPAPTPTPLPAGVEFFDLDPARPGLTYDGSPTLGDAKAPLLLIAFEDLKSADSAQYAKTVEPILREKYVKGGQVRVMLKLFPTDAPQAAGAALCAASLGKFWEFRDLLFTKQAEWKDGDTAAMTNYAKTAGVDEAKFKACLADPTTQARVDEASQFGQDVGVPSVPAYLLIDLRQGQAVANLLGAQPLAEFESKIQTALNPPAAAPTPTAVTK